jgi:MFS family permease
MDAISDPERPLPGAPERLATRVAFFISGFGMAAWAPLVPFAKERLGTDDGTLSLLLLCLGAGSSIAMPLSGGLAARFGCRRVIWAGCLGISVSLPLLGLAPTGASLALALLLFGAGIGAADVAMNIQAVIVEKTGRRTMMSGFHGLYSVEGIAGAGGVSGLL